MQKEIVKEKKRTTRPVTKVINVPPRKPSQVFLGESLMSGVFPHMMPNMYAQMSLAMTRDAGRMSLDEKIKQQEKHGK
jgi:hypothetical protein